MDELSFWLPQNDFDVDQDVSGDDTMPEWGENLNRTDVRRHLSEQIQGNENNIHNMTINVVISKTTNFI